MSGREFSAAADLGDVVSEVRRSERVPAKKAKEAQLEAARLAKELAAAAELEQQVASDLEACSEPIRKSMSMCTLNAHNGANPCWTHARVRCAV